MMRKFVFIAQDGTYVVQESLELVPPGAVGWAPFGNDYLPEDLDKLPPTGSIFPYTFAVNEERRKARIKREAPWWAKVFAWL